MSEVTGQTTEGWVCRGGVGATGTGTVAMGEGGEEALRTKVSDVQLGDV